MLKMFSVQDLKAGFMEPFYKTATGIAVRAWETTVNDAKSQFNHYPSDFILWEIGEFHEETGEIKMHERKINLGSASAFIKKPDKLLNDRTLQKELQPTQDC